MSDSKECSFINTEIPLKISVQEAWHLPGSLHYDYERSRPEEKGFEPMHVMFEEDEDLAQEWASVKEPEEPEELKEMNLLPGDLLCDAMSVPADWASVTTVMMRNLPNKYTQQMLLTEVNSCGFFGSFDFLYLPIDTETAANRGYAFMNFLDPPSAWMFRCMFEGRKMSRFNSKKVISVVPATLQGFDANFVHYNRARVSRGDISARPLFLRDPLLPGLAQFDHTEPFIGAKAYGAVDEESSPSLSVEEAAMPYLPKFCSQCGGRIQLMFQFCPSCGAALGLRGW